MKSVFRFVDGNAVAAEVRMQRQTHKGTILLLEGATDLKRFERFIDDIECLSIDSHGRPNVIQALKISNQMRLRGILAIVDADFSRILERLEVVDNLIYSQFHDLDVDCLFSDSLTNYLSQMAEANKLASEGGISKIRDAILKALMPLSLLRYVNQLDGLRYNLKEINHSCFFDGYVINKTSLVNEVSQDVFSTPAAKKALTEKIQDGISSMAGTDLYQLTNGHDMCAALGIMLLDRLGSRHSVLCRAREIETGLRLSMDQTVFRSLKVFEEIVGWEKRNAPYLVLRYDVRVSSSVS